MATGYGLLFRLSYVLAGVLLVAWVWSRLSIRGLEVELVEATRETEVGGWAEERLRVRNNTRVPKTWVEVQDQTDLPGHRGGNVVGLPRHEFRSWKLRTRCLRRGVFNLGPFTVTSGDPFGFFRYSRTIGVPHTLLVYPKTVPLGAASLGLMVLLFLWRRGLGGLGQEARVYLHLTRLAGWAGMGPQASQTPREFGASLAQMVPRAQGEIKLVVDGYAVATYGRRRGPAQRQALGEAWSRLRWSLLWRATLGRLGRQGR